MIFKRKSIKYSKLKNEKLEDLLHKEKSNEKQRKKYASKKKW